MTLRFLRTASLCAFLSLPIVLVAQESSSKEEQRLEALTRESTDWYVPKNTLSIGFRVLGSGARVDYGNLGTVPFQQTAAPASDGAVTRAYDNGVVSEDGLRTDEKDADGNQTSTPGGRYQVYTTTTVNDTDADGNVTGTHEETNLSGDYVSFTAGLTRAWGYASTAQVSPDGSHIAFSTYSATSEGGIASHKQGPTGGVEFQLNRAVGKLSKRVEWGFAAGVALNDINNKVGGSVSATLHTQTDFYSLNGQAAPAPPFTAPSFTDITASDGTVLVTGGYETTTPIAAVPDGSAELTTPGGTTVNGNWQVKGAYLMIRLGPSLRTQLTERLGLSASLGIAGAYSGTRYSAVESFAVPDLEDTFVTTTEESSATKFLGGYYADLNFEWAASERTGFFGGISAQKFGDYDQSVGGRTAHIDIGSSVGLRGGISIKF